jgi:hypothetical protein
MCLTKYHTMNMWVYEKVPKLSHNKINYDNNKHLRSNTKGYGSKTH